MEVHGSFVDVHEPSVVVHGHFVGVHRPSVVVHGSFMGVHGPSVVVHGLFVDVHGPFVVLHRPLVFTTFSRKIAILTQKRDFSAQTGSGRRATTLPAGTGAPLPGGLGGHKRCIFRLDNDFWQAFNPDVKQDRLNLEKDRLNTQPPTNC
jgi:hypothetical protein